MPANDHGNFVRTYISSQLHGAHNQRLVLLQLFERLSLPWYVKKTQCA